MSSLPASLYKRKFEEFSMNGGPGFNKKNSSHLCDEFPCSAIQLPAAISIWESSGFPVLRSENIQLPEDESSGSCILPGRSRQVLSAPFGKLRRFCPIYDFSSDNSAVSRSCLQADTGVIRLQPYLRQTSLNFPKWEMLSFIQHLTVRS